MCVCVCIEVDILNLIRIPFNITNIATTVQKTCSLTKRLNFFMNDKYVTFIIIRFIWFQHTIFND